MPTKPNWAGEQQEYYPAGSSNGGEYAKGSGGGGSKFDGKPNSQMDSFFNELTTQTDSINKLPEEHQNTKPIKSEEDFSKIKTNIKVVGKDGKTYTYNDPFIKEWMDAVKLKAKRNQTFIDDKKLANGGMSEERVAYDKQQIQEEIKKQESDLRSKGVEPKYERKATFVFGLPAAGKSTLAEPLKQEMGAFEIDADLMKQRIPEFQKDPQMVSAVHEESSWMSKQMQQELIDKGANLVLGKVGGQGNYDSVKGMIDKLKAQGYEVNIVVAHKDIDKALESNLGRFINRYNAKENWSKKPPRIVNTDEHYKTQKTYFDTTIKFFNDGDITNYKMYDVNDKEPKLIREQKKGD